MAEVREEGLDAGIDFGVEHHKLGFAVFLRYGVIRLHLYGAERLLAGDHVVRAIESSQRESEKQCRTLYDSHNGFDILTKWQGSLVTTSWGNGAVPVSA